MISVLDKTLFPPEEVIGRECKFVLYKKAVDKSPHDALFIKERIHFRDGTTQPHCYIVEDYERDFYITKPGFRHYKEKKEYEELSRLDRYRSTQRDLARRIADVLPNVNPNQSLSGVFQNPFIFGCECSTPVLMKHAYQTQWPGLHSPNRVAALDIETDVVNGKGETPILISISCGPDKLVYGVKSFYPNIPSLKVRFKEKMTELIGEYLDKWETDVDFEVYDTPYDILYAAFKRLHAIKPDFVSIWNMAYDLPRIITTIERAGVRVADVFSDPCVPERYRHAKLVRGREERTTQAGVTFKIQDIDRWDVMECFASFYFIDAMSVYKLLRIAGGKERSYSLDAILTKELGIRKLKFEEADGLVGLQWHRFLQTHYPIEYGVYNLFDTVSMEELDNKTHDLEQTVGLLIGHSEYKTFPSTPRRLADDMEFFTREKGLVLGTTSSDLGDHPLDTLVVGRKHWIVTLPAHMVIEPGLHCIKDSPSIRTLIFTHTADGDLESSYPTLMRVTNQSKATTKLELSSISGVSESTRRRMGMNLCGGYVNASQFCQEIYDLPEFTELTKLFD